MGADKKMFSYAEVASHNVAKDCWVIINAKAYQVTNFLADHPGGDEILLAVAGKDASEDFENAGHGSAARLMLDEFYVGEIDPWTLPATTVTTSAPPKQIRNNVDMLPSDFTTKLLRFRFRFRFLLLPTAVLVVAAAIHLYT